MIIHKSTVKKAEDRYQSFNLITNTDAFIYSLAQFTNFSVIDRDKRWHA